MYKNTFPVQDDTDLLYIIALTLLPGIGDRKAKRILSITGNAQDFFRESLKLKSRFQSDAITKTTINQALTRAGEELNFMERQNLQCLVYTTRDYPQRLRICDDSPIVLYLRGNMRLNDSRFIAIVGSRKSTPYGEELCDALVAQLALYNCTLVSGLAHGIDSRAHKAGIIAGVQNIGVLAHGLDRLYPSVNNNLSRKMGENGGVVTDFLSGTRPDRENFPKRNRIVAGLADAVIVVEAAKSGGALITADIANSYGREVFAIPGRIGDEFSQGCNNLIRNNKAALLSDPSDLAWYMGWEKAKSQSTVAVQQQLFNDFTPDEDTLINLIRKQTYDLDLLSIESGFPIGKTSAILLGLEFKGTIKSQPGKRYQLCS